MKKQYPLFQSHLDLAHDYWKRILKPGDLAIDATCGNGHDTFFLAELGILDKLYSYDIQSNALKNASLKLESLPLEIRQKVTFVHQSHQSFLSEIHNSSIKLIVYNLGFLPGGDKNVTTQLESTMQSIQSAMAILAAGGLISVTCYSGHEEGAKEEQALRSYLSALSPMEWSYSHQFWYNRRMAPSLILLQKAL